MIELIIIVQPIDEEILTHLLNNERSQSITDISTTLHHGRHTIARHLDYLLLTGKVSMRQHGLKKKFYIPTFVPRNSIDTFSPHIQIILKKDYTILQVNDQFLHIVHTTKESVVGLRLGSLQTNILDVKTIVERMQTIKEGQSIIFEDTMHIQGKDLFFQFTISLFSYLNQDFLIFLSGEDISARKELEQNIQKREEQFRTLTHNIPGIVFRINIETKQFEYCSHLFEISGYSPELLPTYDFHPLESLIHPSDLQSVHAAIERSIATEEGYKIEYRIRHRNGHLIYLDERGKPTSDHFGFINYIDGIINDVSDRKRIEKKLIESENRLHHALEGAREGLWEWNFSQNTGYFSPQYYQMIGYEPGEFPVTFDSWSSLLHPDEKEALISDFLNQVQNKMERIENEYRLRTKDGEWVWVLARGKPFTWDDKGNVSRVIGTNVDITRQKNAEIALKESEERFSKLVDISNTGIADHDIICNEAGDPIDCRFLYVNPAFERISGHPASDIIGKTLQEVFPGIVPHWLKYLGEVALTGKTVQFSEYSPVLGGYFDIIAFAPRIGQFTIMIADTTDRKAAHEALVESRALLEFTQGLAKLGGWEWDVERQIMRMTEEAYRIYGFEPGGLVPGSPEYYLQSSACYLPDDRRIINDLFSRCIHERESFNREFPITTVDGRHIWIRITAQAVIDGDRVTKIIGSIHDITDQKVAEFAVTRD